MAAKLSEGDTIAMQGEVTMVHDDGSVTVEIGHFEAAAAREQAITSYTRLI